MGVKKTNIKEGSKGVTVEGDKRETDRGRQRERERQRRVVEREKE